ncbi:MAG: hypothetical protein LUE11_03030 [Clostridia bacterium]|nr:hypothetical protein [Clostridia bacterium]
MFEIVLLILIAVFSVVLQIVVHEAGHLVFGLATGYRFISFTIFHFKIYKENEKISIGKSSVAGAGGQCAMEPGDEESDNIPYFLYNAGGVIFNLLSGILFSAIAFMFPEGTMMRTAPVFAAIVSFFFVVSNGIPMRTRLIANDAYNILMMIGNPSARRAFWRIMKINAAGSEGKTPLDLPEEWFADLPDNDYRNPLLCGFAIDRIYYHLERQNYKKVLFICNKIIETKGVLGIYRNEAICEKQFCEIMLAVKAGSENVEYSLKDKILKERLDPLTSYHTIYAHAAFVLHDKNKAAQTIRDFHIMCRKDCNKCIVEYEKYIFGLLEIISF